MSEVVLSLKNLETRYGQIYALKGISLDVYEGEIVTLLGSNGAGKSTTLRTISNLVPACGGKVEFYGKDITNAPPHSIVEMGVIHVPEGRRIFKDVALGVKAINQGKKAVFYRVHDLINQLETDDAKQIAKVYKKIQQADLLILDEWGYLPLHQEGARLLFDIISLCYENKSIIITTNIEFGRWKGFLFDEKLTAAIVDRLVHHSHMLMFTGKSYRMTNSLMK